MAVELIIGSVFMAVGVVIGFRFIWGERR